MLYLKLKYLVQGLSFSLLLSCNQNNTVQNPTARSTNHSESVNRTTVVVEEEEKQEEDTPPEVDYQLTNPDAKFKLPKELIEISGLTCYQDDWLVAVQDERGALFFIDINTGDTEEVIEFAADGDYEGITSRKDLLYVLRADGVLFKVDNWSDKDDINTEIINTNLGEINNTEGLVYDKRFDRFLIACKGSAIIGEDEHEFRSIYGLDAKAKKHTVKSAIAISKQQCKDYIKEHLKEHLSYPFYHKAIKKSKKELFFQPSGIAIHPITQDYYILSAHGNTLMVMNRGKNIKQLYHLSTDMFEQPEGICFNSKGDLFIASEGLEKKARIYRFNYRSKR